MPHRKAAGLVVVVSAAFVIAAPAGAVVKGTRTTALSHSTVRLVGDGNCSGVVIARRAVVTAGHCAAGMSVLAGGRIYRVAHISRSAKLDDGTTVRVSGDGAILLLSSPLPDAMEAIPIGEGNGDTYVIAGYGTTNERWRGAGPLHQAELVKAGDFALVDPSRKGLIGASALLWRFRRAGDPRRPVGRRHHTGRTSIAPHSLRRFDALGADQHRGRNRFTRRARNCTGPKAAASPARVRKARGRARAASLDGKLVCIGGRRVEAARSARR